MSKKDKFLAAAQKFLEKGSLDKALVEFQRAAAEDAKDTRTWLRIAEIHVKRGENAQATQVYLKTADLYVEQGFFQRAVAVYKNVLKLTPGHTDAHFKLADVYKQLGLFSDAAQQYDQAATALQRAGQLKQAMGALSQIVEMNPDQVMSRVKLAEVAAQAGQTEDALREFSRAADQLDAQGRTDDWLRVAEKLIALQPESYNLAKKAASRYLERQNAKAALARLQPCFEVMPRDLETLQLLATTFEQLGQGGKAISVLKELVKVHEDQRQRAERNAVIHRILAIDPGDPISGSLTTPLPEVQKQSLAARATITDPSRPIKRDAAITFSELQIPASIAMPSGSYLAQDAAPDLGALDDEQRAAEVQRIITESDIFVKYGLTERASEHLRRVFELQPDNLNARERLAAVLVQLGRKTEAVEELGLMAEGLLDSDPEAAEKHLRRALDLDPNAVGARAMLERLRRGTIAGPVSTGLEAESELEELDMDELELEPAEGTSAGQPLSPSDILAEADEDEFAAPRTQMAEQLSDIEGYRIGSPPNARTAILPPPAGVRGQAGSGEEEDADDWGAPAATQIESGFGQGKGMSGPSLAAAAAAARLQAQGPQAQGVRQPEPPAPPAEAEDEFGSGSSTMFVPGLDMEMEASVPHDRATAIAPARALPPEAMPPPMLDDLDLGFEVGTPIPERLDVERPTPIPSPGPTPVMSSSAQLDASTLGDLEQIDFFLEQGLPDEARALLDDLSPALANHGEILRRRAQLERLLGGAQDATRALPSPVGAVPRSSSITPRAVVTTGGADAQTFRDLGIAYKEMGLHDAAVAEFAKLVDDPEHEVFALTMMGECYELRGAPAEALLHYKKALNRPSVREEESTQLYYQLGRVFHTLGDESEALYFFEKVARRAPGFADVAQRVASLRSKGVAPMDRGALGPEGTARSGAAGNRRR
jgi:pilus assembly protein FimV